MSFGDGNLQQKIRDLEEKLAVITHREKMEKVLKEGVKKGLYDPFEFTGTTFLKILLSLVLVVIAGLIVYSVFSEARINTTTTPVAPEGYVLIPIYTETVPTVEIMPTQPVLELPVLTQVPTQYATLVPTPTPTVVIEKFVILPIKLNGQSQTGWSWMEVADPRPGYTVLSSQDCGINSMPSFTVPEAATSAFILVTGSDNGIVSGSITNASKTIWQQGTWNVSMCYPVGLKYSLWIQ